MGFFLFLALRTIRGVFTVTLIQRERSEVLGRVLALHPDPALTGILTLNISVAAPVLSKRSDYNILNLSSSPDLSSLTHMVRLPLHLTLTHGVAAQAFVLRREVDGGAAVRPELVIVQLGQDC